MLQADAATVVEERLVVLVVVVEVVLRPQHRLDDLRGGSRPRTLHVGDVAESADAAGDPARRRTFERRDDADDVAVALRCDVDDAEHRRVDLVDRRLGGVGDDLAEHLVAGGDDEPDRVDRRRRAGREHRPLDTLLAAVVEERPHVGEVPELGLVHRRLGAGRERAADLGDHQADAARRDLHPVERCTL